MKEITKQRLARLVRRTHLLAGVDYALFLRDRLRHRRANRLFAARRPDYPLHPPDLMFEAFGHTSLDHYARTGEEHALLVARFMKEHVAHPEPRVCEWGCGPGRIIRHLPGHLGRQRATFFGVDFNPHSIEWCRRHLSDVDFRRNHLHPPLPFPEAFFDFVYAVSVFTHLDASGWRNWMQELSRVTKEDAVVFFSTHGRSYLPKLLHDEQKAFLSGRPVFRRSAPRGKKCFAAYHPGEFVRENIPETFRVLLHEDAPESYGLMQDVWLLRKAPCPSAAVGEPDAPGSRRG